jgi:HPt (histidine-containing phosphotransfer) domain-containing protein
MFLESLAVFPWQIKRGRDVENSMANSNALKQKPAAEATQPVDLDVAFLNQNTFGDKGLRREIISLFQTQLNDVDAALYKPLDRQSWRYMAHTLKGAASAVGAAHIAVLAEQWETSGMPLDASGLHDCQARFIRAVVGFNAAAQKLLSNT